MSKDWLETFSISKDQIEPSGPSDPLGVRIRMSSDQWSAMVMAYNEGQAPFGCEPKPSNPYLNRMDELLPGDIKISKRRELIEREIKPEVTRSEGEIVSVKMANGKVERVVRGIGLQKVDPDDPILKRTNSWGVTIL